MQVTESDNLGLTLQVFLNLKSKHDDSRGELPLEGH